MAEEKQEYLDLEGLTEYHGKVNDMTTGINLVRGSRDFTNGTKSVGTLPSSRPIDGFYTNYVTTIIHETDSDGFGVISIPGNSLSSAITMDSYFDGVVNGAYTISCEIYCSDANEFKPKAVLATFLLDKENNTSVDTPTNITGGTLGLVSNGWVKCRFETVVDLTGSVKPSDVLFAIRMQSTIGTKGTIKFRKLKIEQGSINNPVWSPSPFDIDYINDITTGINLLRGTKDFRQGDTPYKSTANFVDGFYIATGNRYISIDRKSDEFAVATISKTGLTTDTLTSIPSSVIENVKPGEVYTLSCDLLIESLSEFDDQTAVFYISIRDGETDGEAGAAIGNVSYRQGTEDFKENEWNKFVYTFTIPKFTTNTAYLMIQCRTRKNGTVKYRKMAVNVGHINNPIWSPSPFDVDYINDETSGINLLRGTRDFVQGTKRPIGNSAVFTDGFARPNSVYATYATDEQGFMVCTLDATTVSSNVQMYIPAVTGLKTGDIYTFSFEFRIDSSAIPSSVFTTGIYRAGSILQPMTSPATTILIGGPTIEPGVWYKARYIFVVTANTEPDDFVATAIRALQGYKVSFRKLCYYRGNISNPIWSISPFDTEYINDETTGINLLRATRDFEAGTVSAGVRETGLKSDGTNYTAGQWEIIKPENPNEFFIAKRINTGTASHLYFNPLLPEQVNGSPLTISFEFMIDDISTTNTNLVQILVLNNSNSTVVLETYVSFTSLGYSDFTKVPVETWVKAVHTTSVFNITSDQYVRIGLVGNSGQPVGRQFRKVKAEIGKVNNPVWSASPLDYVSSTLTEEKPYLIGNLKTDRVIPQNADLNDIYEPGTYYCNLDVNVRTLKNCPVSQAFKMTVEVPTGRASASTYQASYLRQKITVYNDPASTWYRWQGTGASNAWNSWTTRADGMYLSKFPYVSGLYEGVALSQKFSGEYASSNIANWLSYRASQGNFEGIHIGDFVDISVGGKTVRYRVGAIDPYYGTGSDKKLGHHIVMVPDVPWTLSTAIDGTYGVGTSNSCISWATTNSNNGTSSQNHPYLASNLHKWETEVFLSKFPQEWQDAMVERQALLEGRYSASSTLTDSTGYTWQSLGKIWSPSEVEVYGTIVWGTPGITFGTDSQFPIFSQSKNRNSRSGTTSAVAYWLRTVCGSSSVNVCTISGTGSVTASPANGTSTRPLPCFIVG